MKKTLLLIPLIFGLGSSAWATACASGTLASYETTGFSCSVGDLTFSDFSYIPIASGGASAPDASGVAVTPVIGPSDGLLFTAAWLVGVNQTEDSSISYDVSTTNPGGIEDLELILVGGAVGTGIASAAETSVAPAESLFTGVGSGTNVLTDSATFPPVGSLSLTKDIGVSGGTAGAAHVSGVTNLFSEGTSSTVPEPSLLILCTGLMGLVPVARRKLGL